MIIFGLGNPLPKYKETRHNVGFMVMDRLAKQLSLRFTRRSDYHIAQSGKLAMALIKPMLYMNNSGIVVSDYLQSTDASVSFIVVYDDMALPLGKIRIREKGSNGGHQGLASIIYHLQITNFPRLRIGIGQPSAGVSATDYVLAKFLPEEELILDKVIETSCSALMRVQESGIKAAMNQYNAIQFKIESEAKSQ